MAHITDNVGRANRRTVVMNTTIPTSTVGSDSSHRQLDLHAPASVEFKFENTNDKLLVVNTDGNDFESPGINKIDDGCINPVRVPGVSSLKAYCFTNASQKINFLARDSLPIGLDRQHYPGVCCDIECKSELDCDVPYRLFVDRRMSAWFVNLVNDGEIKKMSIQFDLIPGIQKVGASTVEWDRKPTLNSLTMCNEITQMTSKLDQMNTTMTNVLNMSDNTMQGSMLPPCVELTYFDADTQVDVGYTAFNQLVASKENEIFPRTNQDCVDAECLWEDMEIQELNKPSSHNEIGNALLRIINSSSPDYLEFQLAQPPQSRLQPVILAHSSVESTRHSRLPAIAQLFAIEATDNDMTSDSPLPNGSLGFAESCGFVKGHYTHRTGFQDSQEGYRHPPVSQISGNLDAFISTLHQTETYFVEGLEDLFSDDIWSRETDVTLFLPGSPASKSISKKE
ncbi:hypothetical protein P153DRAFT_432536 [Dothidotthia symphoricarpi CBS 119687]|uniref:Uncharacterized protein n=1 Tax=Dothidotthia symphoricarpi CBS 119687 TaxID=1392245 RepID=A0A6A6A9D7_9PLEO|nr:uncharacterized protein P153DRAFT_432536 [Dothidotthia symphoricarpi CBS 119687]KAF2128166.1 hypothetical protein P153DRAFT_432536 [Dothidotthia symphoricarpi CBS 119687]